MSQQAAGRPPFRADHVGSLLRPPALKQAFRRHAAKEIGDAEFDRLQDECIRDVVAEQEKAGLRIVTDGEFRRGSYWGRFVDRTEGFEIKAASFTFRNDQGHEVAFTAPYAKGKIGRRQALALDEYEFLAGVTKVAGKITLPAPSTMHFYRCDDYADRKSPALETDHEPDQAGKNEIDLHLRLQTEHIRGGGRAGCKDENQRDRAGIVAEAMHPVDK